MRRLVAVGQVWRRRRDDRRMLVLQVHRADREVELDDNGRRLAVGLSDLRRYWELVG